MVRASGFSAVNVQQTQGALSGKIGAVFDATQPTAQAQPPPVAEAQLPNVEGHGAAESAEAAEARLVAVYEEALRLQSEGAHVDAVTLLQTLLRDPLLSGGNEAGAAIQQLRFLVLKNLAALSPDSTDVLELYKRALQEVSDDAVLWHRLAGAAAVHGHLGLARFALEAGLDLCPQHVLMLEKLMEVSWFSGDGEAACNACQRLLCIDPWHPDARRLAAQFKLAVDVGSATEMLQQAEHEQDWPVPKRLCTRAQAAMDVDPNSRTRSPQVLSFTPVEMLHKLAAMLRACCGSVAAKDDEAAALLQAVAGRALLPSPVSSSAPTQPVQYEHQGARGSAKRSGAGRSPGSRRQPLPPPPPPEGDEEQPQALHARTAQQATRARTRAGGGHAPAVAAGGTASPAGKAGEPSNTLAQQLWDCFPGLQGGMVELTKADDALPQPGSPVVADASRSGADILSTALQGLPHGSLYELCSCLVSRLLRHTLQLPSSVLSELLAMEVHLQPWLSSTSDILMLMELHLGALCTGGRTNLGPVESGPKQRQQAEQQLGDSKAKAAHLLRCRQLLMQLESQLKEPLESVRQILQMQHDSVCTIARADLDIVLRWLWAHAMLEEECGQVAKSIELYQACKQLLSKHQDGVESATMLVTLDVVQQKLDGLAVYEVIDLAAAPDSHTAADDVISQLLPVVLPQPSEAGAAPPRKLPWSLRTKALQTLQHACQAAGRHSLALACAMEQVSCSLRRTLQEEGEACQLSAAVTEIRLFCVNARGWLDSRQSTVVSCPSDAAALFTKALSALQRQLILYAAACYSATSQLANGPGSKLSKQGNAERTCLQALVDVAIAIDVTSQLELQTDTTTLKAKIQMLSTMLEMLATRANTMEVLPFLRSSFSSLLSALTTLLQHWGISLPDSIERAVNGKCPVNVTPESIEMTEELQLLEASLHGAIAQIIFLTTGIPLEWRDETYGDSQGISQLRPCQDNDIRVAEAQAEWTYLCPAFELIKEWSYLTKYKAALERLVKSVPPPPAAILQSSPVPAYLNDETLDENEVVVLGTSAPPILPLLEQRRLTDQLVHEDELHSIHAALYYLYISSCEPDEPDMLTQAGESKVDEAERLLLYDLSYNPLRLVSWNELAEMYKRSYWSLLNHAASNLSPADWASNKIWQHKLKRFLSLARRSFAVCYHLEEGVSAKAEYLEDLAMTFFPLVVHQAPQYDQMAPFKRSRDNALKSDCQATYTLLYRAAEVLNAEWTYQLMLGLVVRKYRQNPLEVSERQGWQETCLRHLAKASALAEYAGHGVIKPLFHLHATRLKWARCMDLSAEDAPELLALLSRHCFLPSTHKQLHPDIQDAPEGIQGTADENVPCLSREQLHGLIINDCMAAMHWCNDSYKPAGQYHPARYQLAKTYLTLGDSDAAHQELKSTFSSAGRVTKAFSIYLQPINENGFGRRPGKDSRVEEDEAQPELCDERLWGCRPQSVSAAGAEESDREFTSAVRKYLIQYIKVLASRQDYDSLEAVTAFMLHDRTWRECLLDMSKVAQGVFVGQVISAAEPILAHIGAGQELDTKSVGVLDKVWSTFVENVLEAQQGALQVLQQHVLESHRLLPAVVPGSAAPHLNTTFITQAVQGYIKVLGALGDGERLMSMVTKIKKKSKQLSKLMPLAAKELLAASSEQLLRAGAHKCDVLLGDAASRAATRSACQATHIAPESYTAIPGDSSTGVCHACKAQHVRAALSLLHSLMKMQLPSVLGCAEKQSEAVQLINSMWQRAREAASGILPGEQLSGLPDADATAQGCESLMAFLDAVVKAHTVRPVDGQARMQE